MCVCLGTCFKVSLRLLMVDSTCEAPWPSGDWEDPLRADLGTAEWPGLCGDVGGRSGPPGP